MDELDRKEFKEIVDSFTDSLNETLLPRQTAYTPRQVEAHLRSPYSLFLIGAALSAQKLCLLRYQKELHMRELLDLLEAMENSRQSVTDKTKSEEIPIPPFVEEAKEAKSSHVILDTLVEIQQTLQYEWKHLSTEIEQVEKLHDDLIHHIHTLDLEDDELKEEQKETLRTELEKTFFGTEKLPAEISAKLDAHLEELHNTLWELGAKKAVEQIHHEEKEEKIPHEEKNSSHKTKLHKRRKPLMQPLQKVTLQDEIRMMRTLRSMAEDVNKVKKQPIQIKQLASYARESLHGVVNGVHEHNVTQHKTLTPKLTTYVTATQRAQQRIDACAARGVQVQSLIKQFEEGHKGSLLVVQAKKLHNTTYKVPSVQEYSSTLQHTAEKVGIKPIPKFTRRQP